MTVETPEYCTLKPGPLSTDAPALFVIVGNDLGRLVVRAHGCRETFRRGRPVMYFAVDEEDVERVIIEYVPSESGGGWVAFSASSGDPCTSVAAAFESLMEKR